MTVKPFTSAAYEEPQPGNTSTGDGTEVATWRRRGAEQVPTSSPGVTGPESVAPDVSRDSFPISWRFPGFMSALLAHLTCTLGTGAALAVRFILEEFGTDK